MWFNLNEQRVRLTPIENGQTMENKKINRIDTRFNSLRGRWKKRVVIGLTRQLIRLHEFGPTGYC